MKILLTGGNGMVGCSLQAQLAGRHDVLAPTRAEVDLLDGSRTRTVLAEHAPDLVIHAAGRVGGIEANRLANGLFLADNVIMGINVVRAAAEAGVPRLLNLASSCMYPRNVEGALREEMILAGQLEPTNEGYALAKIAVTRYCQFISREQPNLRYVTAIPCNLYGPGDSFDPLKAHMLPSALRKLDDAVRWHSDVVEIWGDGSARREFMFVGDFADFVAQALEDFDTLPDVVNVGTGQDHTVQEYYEMAAGIVGYTGSYSYAIGKPAGMRQKLLDCSRVNDWGWHARHNLEEGLRQTYDYYQRQRADLSFGDVVLGSPGVGGPA